MSSFYPAVLIELVDDEPVGDEIEGEAIIFISRDEHGVTEASGRRPDA